MHQLRIAVVEDDSEDSDFFCTALQENYKDLDIVVFSSGESFINYLQSDSELPDLVVTDLRMPLISGFDVIGEMKNSDRTKNVPVMVLSTSDSDEDKSMADDLGVAAYFVKPYSYGEYSTITDRIMNQVKNANPST